ncbi:MAG: hypothetical protein E3J87_08975 [Candidatus Cloacimonadota bacterium]|nr:MAG: hypothetical protein E3J87_08975 [Candidatus Cloacimonadota bacterium]
MKYHDVKSHTLGSDDGVDIKRNIIKFRKGRIFSSFFFYLFLILSIASAFIFCILFLDNLIYLREIYRNVIRILLSLLPVIIILFFLYETKRLWKFGSVVSVMEKRFSVFKGRLFAAVECSPCDPHFSQELIYANLKDVKTIIESLPPVPIITKKHIESIRVLYSLIISIFFLFALSPNRFISSFTRVLFEWDILSPAFVIYPGNGYVEKGYDFEVSLKAYVGNVSKPRLIIEDKKIFFEKKEGRLYKTTIENIERPFTYHVEFSDTFSREFIVDVVEHPRIENIFFTLHYPSYTKEKDYQTSDFDIYALKGTEIEISGKSTQSLKKAGLLWDDSTKIAFEVDGCNFKGDFYVDTTKAFTINLLSEKGLFNAEKPLFHIFSFEDEYPTIEIVEPGEDIDLPQELALDIVVNISDDYGISKVHLVWEKDKEKHTILISSNLKGKSCASEYRWDLMNLPMFPGDTLRYFAEVFDNDVISGPKVKRTRTYTIRFPTAEEIYREIASGGERVQEAFETESNKLEKLKESLQELEKTLRESKKLSWEEKKKAEEIIKKEKELLENIEKTREEMEELTKKLNETFLSNPEIKERLREIEKLMRKIETEKIRKNIERLKEALKKMDRREMLRAMEKMLLSQEEIKKALERTIEILKRIEQEQRFERIVEKAKELEEEQKRINKEMEGKKGEELKDLQSAEKTLEKELGDLTKEMEDLAKELGESDSTAKEALENASEMANDIGSELKKTRQAMEQGKQKQSLSLGKGAKESLSEMSNLLSAGLSSMLSQRRKDIEKRLNAIIEDVVFLSIESEKVMEDIKRENTNDEILAREDGIKDGIKKTLENIDELMSKNPFLSQIAIEELVTAARSIETSANSLVKNNTSGALLYAKRTMKSLNLAALELIESKKNLPSGGSGSMAQLLQQLQSLSSGQMQVNQGTQSLLPIDLSSGDVAQETQSELNRLSELQGSLAERLRRIEEGIEEEGGNILGDLGKMAEEMEEIAREIGNYNIDRELVEREERILSRMLDAQRSVHKREFSKKRVAERPEREFVREPAPLPAGLGEKKGIKKDILKELEEKYPKEYRDLIRAYFEKLLKEERGRE